MDDPILPIPPRKPVTIKARANSEWDIFLIYLLGLGMGISLVALVNVVQECPR